MKTRPLLKRTIGAKGTACNGCMYLKKGACTIPSDFNYKLYGRCTDAGKEGYTYQIADAEDKQGHTLEEYDKAFEMAVKGLTTFRAEAVLFGMNAKSFRFKMEEHKARVHTKRWAKFLSPLPYLKHSDKINDMHFNKGLSFRTIVRRTKLPMFAVRSIVAKEITNRKQTVLINK